MPDHANADPNPYASQNFNLLPSRPSVRVLIHGYHLQAPQWRDVTWGTPTEGRLGRVPAGLLLAYRLGADSVTFGSGASCHGGSFEGERGLLIAAEHIGTLASLAGANPTRFSSWFWAAAKLDIDSQNTNDELTRFLGGVEADGIDLAFSVTSPFHLPRVAATGLKLCVTNNWQKGMVAYSCTASGVDPDNASVGDVVVLEPSHRPDRRSLPLTEFGSALLRLHELDDAAETCKLLSILLRTSDQ
jgi:hypothetical protein